MSTQHLYASYYSAQLAAQAEQHLVAGREPFSMQHRGAVLSAVVESVAFLEAAINEVFQDAADDHHTFVGRLSDACLRAMSAVWGVTNEGRMEVLQKYDLALELGGYLPFDRGAAPFQDVRLLVRLRNFVVHYKPYDQTAESTDKLMKALAGAARFEPNEALQRPPNGEPWSLVNVLGAGCADWAWRSARAFVDEFTGRMNLTLNYKTGAWREQLPR